MELVADGEETGFWLFVVGSEALGECVGIRQAGDTSKGEKEHGTLPRADMEAEASLSIPAQCC